MNNFFKGAALLLGGAVLGAAVALLLTPKTGEEVRKQLADLLEEAKQQMNQKQQEAKRETEKEA